MKKASVAFTVFFQEPFWVGVLECISHGELSVCKVTFGAEPKDYEVCEFLLKNYYSLKLSTVSGADTKERIKNPKRMHREIKRNLQGNGIGTKSQQALKQQYEETKQLQKVNRREEKEAQRQQQFELKQQKKKEKHRGR